MLFWELHLYSLLYQPHLGNCGLIQGWVLLAWRCISVWMLSVHRYLNLALPFNITTLLYCNCSTHFTLKFNVFSAKIVCLENWAADIIWPLGNAIVYFIAKVEGEIKAILPETQLSAICICKILNSFPEGSSICVLNRLEAFKMKG